MLDTSSASLFTSASQHSAVIWGTHDAEHNLRSAKTVWVNDVGHDRREEEVLLDECGIAFCQVWPKDQLIISSMVRAPLHGVDQAWTGTNVAAGKLRRRKVTAPITYVDLSFPSTNGSSSER